MTHENNGQNSTNNAPHGEAFFLFIDFIIESEMIIIEDNAAKIDNVNVSQVIERVIMVFHYFVYHMNSLLLRNSGE